MKKYLSILLVLLMLTLVACTERQVPEEIIVETPIETEVETEMETKVETVKENTQEEIQIPEDGTYTGTAKGYSGDIEVEVVVEGGKITSVKVLKESETPEIGGAAKDTISQQIVEANALNIDGVAGATITTDGIKEAVKNALSGSVPTVENDANDEGFTIPEDGTYTGTAKGYSGDIEVEVTVEGGKITSVKVIKESETPEIGGAAKDTVSQKIVDANSLEIDGVSGATITTDGIKDAVKDALNQ